MALDTAQKRRSIVNMGLPWRSESIPAPDGTISESDRHQFLHLYGIPFATTAAAAGLKIITSITKDVLQSFMGIVNPISVTSKIRT